MCSIVDALGVCVYPPPTMANAVRILLRPLTPPGPSRELQTGARIEMTAFGDERSMVKPDVPQPAKLTLYGTFLSRIRGSSEEETRPFGHLEGEMVLRGATQAPVFIGAADESGRPRGWTSNTPLEPAGASEASAGEYPEPSRRVLRLEFSSQFEQVPSRGEELIIQVDVRRFRYLEVRAELEVGGQVEARKEVNDVLDVLLTRTNPPRVPDPVVVRLTDEHGQPASKAKFHIVSGGELEYGGQQGTADDHGQIVIKPQVGVDHGEIRWSTSAGECARRLFFVLGSGIQGLERRLQNLGYVAGPTVEDDVRAFQREFRRDESGMIAHIRDALTAWHDRGELPRMGPEAALGNEPVAFRGPPDGEDLSDPSYDSEST